MADERIRVNMDVHVDPRLAEFTEAKARLREAVKNTPEYRALVRVVEWLNRKLGG